MKKKYLAIISILTILSFNKNIYAFDVNNYKDKSLCGNYEVAGFHSDGVIDPVYCTSSYDEAKSLMENNGARDLAIMTKVNGKTKIIDVNYGLVRLNMHQNNVNTYIYDNSNLTNQYKWQKFYFNGSYGEDGGFLGTSHDSGQWAAHIRIADTTGWVGEKDYELIPITWLKSSSSYTINSESISHNEVSDITVSNSAKAKRAIGPKPTMLATGTYYSFDGHYFYNTLESLMQDYKNNSIERAVNKNNPYYNYYMYLNIHTKSNYSSTNINDYIKNNMGKTKNAYGDYAESGASTLYGMGTYFYHAQEKYGTNALLTFSLSRNETGNGTSNISISKNNGFGLNAVDSNPYASASRYAYFENSIIGFANDWMTYNYAKADASNYFGSQFGDKQSGINIKYASDPYWSEKMAQNYFYFDQAHGFQDYNYYQEGLILNGNANAYLNPSTNSKVVYTYPDTNRDAIVIVDKVENDGKLWYKIVSDMNIDSNGNQIPNNNSGYNWNAYVYVDASNVKLLNKVDYKDTNSVTEYQDSTYTYEFYTSNGDASPKVAISTKDSSFFEDSLLQQSAGNLQKDRYLMVYAKALDKNKNIVAYYVTSDYNENQKRWINSNSLRFVNSSYASIDIYTSTKKNLHLNICKETVDYKCSSGKLYSYTYVPILETLNVSGKTWYKVPLNSSNSYGYIPTGDSGVTIALYNAKVENNPPVIEASDKTILEKNRFNPLDNVKATDTEDGDLTSKIKVKENTVDVNTPGTYKVVYEVTDSNNSTTTKEIKVIVKENKKPEIIAEDKEIIEYRKFNPLDNVKATDTEDGDLTSKIKVKENSVDVNIPGTYKVVYEVTDSNNSTTTKEIKIMVIKDEAPVISAEDKIITQGTKFDPLDDVSATDKEEGPIKDIKVVENTVNVNTPGEYKVVYKAVDSYKNETTKEIKVIVVKNQLPVITAQDKNIYLNENFDPLADVEASDPEDGKIKDIKVIENTVNTKELGEYKVIYEVEDSYGNKVDKEIKVSIIEKKLKEKDGEFYLESLDWSKTNKKFTVSGYLIIYDIDNTNKKYEMILKDINSSKEYSIDLNSWTKDTPYDLGTENGKSYSDSWFKGTLDMSDIPNGDYDLYVRAESGEYYTEQLFDNVFNTSIDKRGEDKNHGYNFKVLQRYKNKAIQINIRKELYTTSTSPTYRNMINDFDTIELRNNKLYLLAYSYNYNGTYSKQSNIKRTLILENQDNFKQTYIDLGSSKGPFDIKTKDNKDKTYAWFEKEINLEDLDKGTYSLQVYTKTIDAEDYGILNDSFGTFKTQKTIINGKTYQVQINKKRENRVELIVE